MMIWKGERVSGPCQMIIDHRRKRKRQLLHQLYLSEKLQNICNVFINVHVHFIIVAVYKPSFVLLQCRLLALYRILLPVFIRTHCGTGLLHFILCASLRLMINVLWEGITATLLL